MKRFAFWFTCVLAAAPPVAMAAGMLIDLWTAGNDDPGFRIFGTGLVLTLFVGLPSTMLAIWMHDERWDCKTAANTKDSQ